MGQCTDRETHRDTLTHTPLKFKETHRNRCIHKNQEFTYARFLFLFPETS